MPWTITVRGSEADGIQLSEHSTETQFVHMIGYYNSYIERYDGIRDAGFGTDVKRGT